MVASPGFRFVEALVLIAGSLMGLPPGDRDPALVRSAPKDAVVYVEWSARGLGKTGAPGIDGLAADPEIRQFLDDVERAFVVYLEQESAGGAQTAKIAGKNLPPLVHAFLSRSGCFFASFDARAAQAAAEKAGGPSPEAIVAALKGALIINGGDQADAIEQGLRNLLALLPKPPESTELKNLALRLPGFPLPIVLHRHEKYIIAATDKSTVEQAVAGLSGRSRGLGDNSRFIEAQKRVQGARTACLSWFDVKSGFEGATAALGPIGPFVGTIAKLVGASEIDSVACHTGVEKGQVRSACYLSTSGKLPGILALAAGRKIEASDFAHIPADADLAAAVSLNVPKIYEEIERIAAGTSVGAGERLDEVVKGLEDQLGFSLKKDLFAAFGDVWTLYDSPSEGGLFVTSLVAGLEVRDPAKAKMVFERLIKLLNDNLPGRHGNFRRSGIVLDERKFLDETIYFVSSTGDNVPVAPAFCLTEKHLLAALHPQALKAHLRFMKEKGPALPDKIRSALQTDGATIAYATFDAKRFVRIVYAFAPYLAQMACNHLQQEGLPINVFSFPSARAVLPYIGPCSCRVTRMEKGILMETDSNLPVPENGLLLFAIWMAVGRSR